jgi:hypothetical protein
VGFEVLFEGDGFVLIAKGDECFDVSGKVFGGVEDWFAVVSFKAGFQVCGDSGIVAGAV